jgi:predicted esterase
VVHFCLSLVSFVPFVVKLFFGGSVPEENAIALPESSGPRMALPLMAEFLTLLRSASMRAGHKWRPENDRAAACRIVETAFVLHSARMSQMINDVHEFRAPREYTILLPSDYTPDRSWPLVMALHGMGRREDVMRRQLAPLLNEPWIFCFPRGVLPFEMRKPGRTRIGYAWYVFDGDQDALRLSMKESCRWLLELRRALASRYATVASAVVGFSQGGYLAGVLATREPGSFSAAACIAGRLKWEFMPDGGGARLAQIHGGLDESVAPELARQALEGARGKGYACDYFEDPQAGHEISAPMLEFLRQWLRGALAHDKSNA